ncbi:HalOD1 output domain-containing protein [Halostella pelagica]|uniref:HalOD1 output domain-containing protein n=1 Tax=Halostella pelagica TaxID=2583824 RepID=UPI00108107E8|nr:HalOD1 output domain-containing protein [Halostella pelagica]
MTEPDIVSKIVKAVAAADGVDTAELDSLYEYINPEALYTLCEQERGEWSFTFQFSDHQVTVTHDSQILVDGVAHTPDVSNRFDA